jgi:hypothetical protein
VRGDGYAAPAGRRGCVRGRVDPVNLAPLVAIRVGDRLGVEDLPRAWFESLDAAGVAVDTLVGAVLNDPTLRPMVTQGYRPTGLGAGLIGLVSDEAFPGAWDAQPGKTPSEGWWPEAIRLADGQPLAYPADPDPLPVLAFFAPVQRSSVERPGTVELARLVFPLPVGPPTAPPRIVPNPDGLCGYEVHEGTQYRRIECATLKCPQSCVADRMTLDGGRSAVVCGCP